MESLTPPLDFCHLACFSIPPISGRRGVHHESQLQIVAKDDIFVSE
jgi:hypothetical protein